MAIKAFVFDCFGVLYNDAFKDFLQRNAVAIGNNAPYYYDLCNRSDAGTMSNDAFYKELAAVSGEDPQVLMAEFHDTRHLNRGLAKLIRELKPHYKVGLLSNTGRDLLDEFMREHAIQDLFDVVVASSDTGYIKPQRQIFELTARKFNARLDELFFVDDSAANIAAARSYGMSAHMYTTVAVLRQELQGII